jgi:hypothetical protein
LIVTFPISSFAKRTKDDIAKNVNAPALFSLPYAPYRILSPLTARQEATEESQSYIRALALALARVVSFAARIQQQ